MRPQQHPLRARAAAMALGALTLASIPAAHAAADSPVTAKLRDASLRYGEKVVVTGRTAAGPGAVVHLEYRAAGTPTWAPVATARAQQRGAYKLAVRLSRSGVVRVAAGEGTQAYSAAAAAPRSGEQAVRVAADLNVGRRRLNVKAGRTASVAGSVRRPQAGRTVALQA